MQAVLISVSNGPEPAVCRRCLTCRMGSHSITCHSIQANLFLAYIWEEGQTSTYYCRNLLGGKAGTNLYCLVNSDTCVNNLPKVITWQFPARSRTCSLRVTSLACYHYTIKHCVSASAEFILTDSCRVKKAV